MAGILRTAQDTLAAAAQSISGGAVGNEYQFPAFDELPKVDGMPQGSIWGFYDKDGKKDEAGGTIVAATSRGHVLIHTSRQPSNTIRRASRLTRDYHRRTHPT
jgi:hypothetical protein